MAVISVTVGMVVLLGWVFDIETLLDISPDFATMKVNSACGMVMLGVALWLTTFRPDETAGLRSNRGESLARASRILAFVGILIGLLILSEYLFGWELGIDNWLVQDHHTVHNPFPGRISRVSALDFLLLSAAFLSIDVETRAGRRPAQWLAIAVFLDSYIAVLGYIYGVDSLYSIGGYSSMALHTAILFMLLSAGFLLARPGKGLMTLATDITAGGWTFRVLLPTAIVLLPVLGWCMQLGLHAGHYTFEFGLAVLVVSNFVVLSSIIWWTTESVRAHVLARKKIEQKMETDQERAKTEAAILEQRVHERTVKLEEAVAELERSTYIISHNLRAPVRSILAFSHFLITDCGEQLNQTGRDYLDHLTRSAQRMETLMKGVLAYSLTSRSEFISAPVDLDTLVDGLVADYAEGAQIRIVHPLGTVCANECLVEQSISNLMENAVKFVRPGTRPQIEVWSEPHDGNLRLTVHDHGIGVPVESGDRIFRTFERAHEGYPGTGIGLSIVKRAVERMGGQVGFDSKAGEGSSFWIELPKAEASDVIGFGA